MKTVLKRDQLLYRQLDDGLVLRQATPADAEALAEFNSRIHAEPEVTGDDVRLRAWTLDLLTRPHPTFQPGDFTVVEDSRTGKIVSSLCLISQTWSYAGIPFPVGRPELVGTDPEYRNRGLVRKQFEVIHNWSAERGHLLQAITGIPYYYRLFGYEMAVNLGGGRSNYRQAAPQLKEGQSEPYRLRPAEEDDIPLIAELDEQHAQRNLLHCERDSAQWRYEINGRDANNINRYELRMIETAAGTTIGVLLHGTHLWWRDTMITATGYELKPGTSYAEVTPSVIRYLLTTGDCFAQALNKPDALQAYAFWLGETHPLYQVLRTGLPRKHDPYAWYMRVADIPAFLRHIRPVLEQRLAASPLSGHSGEVKLSFYRSGLRLALKNGKLAQIEPWQPEPTPHSGDAVFTGLTFLQLLLGYRTFDELEYTFQDVYCSNDTVYALLAALFPKRPSNIWPLS